MELQLTAWERLELLRCLPENAHLSEMNQLLRIDDVLQLTKEETKQLGGYRESQVVIDGKLGTRVEWDQDTTYTLEIDTADVEKLIQLAERRKAWPRDRRSKELEAKWQEWKKEVAQ